LLMIPSAVSEGKLHNVLPNKREELGSELVINGDFATDTDWGKGANWTISGGKANALNSTGYERIRQSNPISEGYYQISFTISNFNNGDILPMIGEVSGALVTGNGTFTQNIYTNSSATITQIISHPDFTGSIDNVSVKEVTQAELNFDVDRDCNASYINEDGLIANALPNVPRIDFTDGDGALLTEPQSTNIITYPVSFDNAYWTKEGTSVVSGKSAPSVDNPTSAFKLVEDTSTGTHYSRRSISNTLNLPYTFSIKVKAGGRNYIRLQENTLTGAGADFDFVNKTATIIQGNASNLMTTTATITELVNGYFDISFTYKPDATGGYNFYIYLAETLGTISYTGDGTSGVYIYGAQLEALSYPTSLIYNGTEGAQVTRLQDEVTGAGDVNTFNSVEGTLFVEMSALADDLTERRLSLSDGSSSNVVRISYTTFSNRITAIVYNGANQAIMNYTSADITINSKIALKYKANDFAMWVDGVEVLTVSSGSTFSVNTLNSIEFDSGAGTVKMFAKVKQLQVYKTALDDATLTALTS